MNPSPRKTYPRALPFRSPEDITAEAERRQEEMQERLDDLAAQAGSLRRCTYALALALLGAAAVVTTLAVLVVQRPAAMDTRESASEPAPPLAIVPPPAKQPSPAPSTATDVATKDLTLEAMGGLSAANLYQSYLAIGLLADGVEHKAFTTEGAANTLKIVGSCIALVDAKLAKLEKLKLEPDDVASLQQIKTITALMRIQTQALETYWATGKAEHGEAYQRARKATWTGLSKVLGVNAG